MAVRAKFKVENKEAEVDGFKLRLAPVTGGSAENEQFFRYTPWGRIELGTINAAAAEQFELGKEFYVDFTPAT